ncbi:hypothetical protein HK405_002805, partial [Cladochytrium tenue]
AFVVPACSLWHPDRAADVHLLLRLCCSRPPHGAGTGASTNNDNDDDGDDELRGAVTRVEALLIPAAARLSAAAAAAAAAGTVGAVQTATSGAALDRRERQFLSRALPPLLAQFAAAPEAACAAADDSDVLVRRPALLEGGGGGVAAGHEQGSRCAGEWVCDRASMDGGSGVAAVAGRRRRRDGSFAEPQETPALPPKLQLPRRSSRLEAARAALAGLNWALCLDVAVECAAGSTPLAYRGRTREADLPVLPSNARMAARLVCFAVLGLLVRQLDSDRLRRLLCLHRTGADSTAGGSSLFHLSTRENTVRVISRSLLKLTCFGGAEGDSAKDWAIEMGWRAHWAWIDIVACLLSMASDGASNVRHITAFSEALLRDVLKAFQRLEHIEHSSTVQLEQAKISACLLALFDNSETYVRRTAASSLAFRCLLAAFRLPVEPKAHATAISSILGRWEDDHLAGCGVPTQKLDHTPLDLVANPFLELLVVVDTALEPSGTIKNDIQVDGSCRAQRNLECDSIQHCAQTLMRNFLIACEIDEVERPARSFEHITSELAAELELRLNQYYRTEFRACKDPSCKGATDFPGSKCGALNKIYATAFLVRGVLKGCLPQDVSAGFAFKELQNVLRPVLGVVHTLLKCTDPFVRVQILETVQELIQAGTHGARSLFNESMLDCVISAVSSVRGAAAQRRTGLNDRALASQLAVKERALVMSVESLCKGLRPAVLRSDLQKARHKGHTSVPRQSKPITGRRESKTVKMDPAAPRLRRPAARLDNVLERLKEEESAIVSAYASLPAPVSTGTASISFPPPAQGPATDHSANAAKPCSGGGDDLSNSPPSPHLAPGRSPRPIHIPADVSVSFPQLPPDGPEVPGRPTSARLSGYLDQALCAVRSSIQHPPAQLGGALRSDLERSISFELLARSQQQELERLQRLAAGLVVRKGSGPGRQDSEKQQVRETERPPRRPLASLENRLAPAVAEHAASNLWEQKRSGERQTLPKDAPLSVEELNGAKGADSPKINLDQFLDGLKGLTIASDNRGSTRASGASRPITDLALGVSEALPSGEKNLAIKPRGGASRKVELRNHATSPILFAVDVAHGLPDALAGKRGHQNTHLATGSAIGEHDLRWAAPAFKPRRVVSSSAAADVARLPPAGPRQVPGTGGAGVTAKAEARRRVDVEASATQTPAAGWAGSTATAAASGLVRPRLRAALEFVLKCLDFGEATAAGPGGRAAKTGGAPGAWDKRASWGAPREECHPPAAATAAGLASSLNEGLRESHGGGGGALHPLLRAVFRLDLSLLVDLCEGLDMTESASQPDAASRLIPVLYITTLHTPALIPAILTNSLHSFRPASDSGLAQLRSHLLPVSRALARLEALVGGARSPAQAIVIVKDQVALNRLARGAAGRPRDDALAGPAAFVHWALAVAEAVGA